MEEVERGIDVWTTIHLDQLQRIHMINLTRLVVGEGERTHHQLSHSLTVPQDKGPRTLRPRGFFLREGLLPNHHSLQLVQANQRHLHNMAETMVAHLQ